jgi:hypothetical protein
MSRKGKQFLVAILSVALLIRLYIAWRPVPFLMKLNLSDDAFYYFVIARHVVNGQGSTFDGLTLTNGYHPLWLLSILPVFALRNLGPDMRVHLVLSLGALLDVLTCYLLYRVASRMSMRSAAGLIAALFYGLNTMNTLQAVNGLETGLAGTLVAASWWGALRLEERPTLGRAAGWGVLVGLMLLARTDYVILALCLGLYLLVRLPVKTGVRAVMAAAAVSVIVASPWLVWSQVHVGSVMQVSGVAVPYAVHQRHIMRHGHSLQAWISGALNTLLYHQSWLRGDFTGTPPLVGLAWWAVVAVAGGRSWLRGNFTWIWPWLPMAVAATGLVLVHTLIRWYPRPWYFVASAQALAVGLGVGIVEMSKTGPLLTWGRRASSLALTILIFASLASWVLIWQIGLYPWQDRMLAATNWITHNTPEDEIVASLNAGIYGYYSEHTVVNLDGVVNPAAYAAIRERRLFSYMQTASVYHFIDFDHALNNEYGVFMGAGYPEGLVYVGQAAPEPYPGLGVLRAYRVMAP